MQPFDCGTRLDIRRVGTERSVDRLADLTRMYADGRLKVSIWKAFPPARAADAHREVETGHVRGKFVLTVG